MEKRFRGFENAWWLGLLFLAVMFFSQLLLGRLIPQSVSDGWFNIICQLFMLLPCAVGFIVLKKTYPRVSLADSLSVHKFKIVLVPILFFLPYCAQQFFGVILTPLDSLISGLFGSYDPGYQEYMGAEEIALTLLSSVVLAPLIEEFMFRGVIMKLLERYGLLRAVLYSSLIFALMHLDPTSFVMVFLLGMIFALVKYVSGSIWTAVLMHGSNNLLSLLIYLYADNISDLSGILLLFLASMFAPVLFLLAMYICRGSSRWWRGLVWRNNFSHKLSAAMVIFIAIFVGIGTVTAAYNIYQNSDTYFTYEYPEENIPYDERYPFGWEIPPVEEYPQNRYAPSANRS